MSVRIDRKPFLRIVGNVCVYVVSSGAMLLGVMWKTRIIHQLQL